MKLILNFIFFLVLLSACKSDIENKTIWLNLENDTLNILGIRYSGFKYKSYYILEIQKKYRSPLFDEFSQYLLVKGDRINFLSLYDSAECYYNNDYYFFDETKNKFSDADFPFGKDFCLMSISEFLDFGLSVGDTFHFNNKGWTILIDKFYIHEICDTVYQFIYFSGIYDSDYSYTGITSSRKYGILGLNSLNEAQDGRINITYEFGRSYFNYFDTTVYNISECRKLNITEYCIPEINFGKIKRFKKCDL